MVEKEIITFKYYKVIYDGELIGLVVDRFNGKGEQRSSSLYQISQNIYPIMDTKEITFDEFRFITCKTNLLKAPESPEPTII